MRELNGSRPGERLVEDDETRVSHEFCGEGDAAMFAAAESLYAVVAAVGESKKFAELFESAFGVLPVVVGVHRDSCTVTEGLVDGQVAAQGRVLREDGDALAYLFAAVVDAPDMHFAIFALAVSAFEKLEKARLSLPGTPDDGKNFACGQVEVYARKQLLFAGEYIQVAHVDIEPYGRFPEQYRPVLCGDFRLVVARRLAFAEEHFLVAFAFFVGYRMAERDFCAVPVLLEKDFVFRAFLVDFLLCRLVSEFDGLHFVVHVEQQQRKFSVLQVCAHLLYADADHVAVADFRFAHLHVVEHRETVFRKALDMPFKSGGRRDTLDYRMFPRYELFREE